jgi:hypothetical protein
MISFEKNNLLNNFSKVPIYNCNEIASLKLHIPITDFNHP